MEGLFSRVLEGLLITAIVGAVGLSFWIKSVLKQLDSTVNEVQRKVGEMREIMSHYQSNNFGYDFVKDSMSDYNVGLQQLVQMQMNHSEKVIEAINNLMLAIKDLEIAINKLNGRS